MAQDVASEMDKLFTNIREITQNFEAERRLTGEDLLLIPVPCRLLEYAGTTIDALAERVATLPEVQSAESYPDNLILDKDGAVMLNKFQQDLEVLKVVLQPKAPEVN